VAERTQILVLGGGPAGSTAATLLAREGFRVTLLEREHFPREHIGESLLPSILTMLDLLGVREKFEAHGFIKKYGGYFEWGADEWEIVFGDPDEADSGYGFQVVRSEFDQILLEHSRSEGVDVREGVKANEVLYWDGRPCAVRWTQQGERRKGEIAFDYLIDASGRAGLMATHYLDNRLLNEGFRNIAIYSYWSGTKPPEHGPQGSVLVGSIEDGWIWGIPLHDGTLSVGAVMHTSAFKHKRAALGSVEAVYADVVGRAPLIANLLASGRRVRPIRVEQDFSYVCERPAGPGFFLAGDAACFLDPLLSTGVHLATFSGLLAAAGTASILRGEMDETAVADYYCDAYQTAYVRFLTLVSSLYLNYRGKESLFWEAQRISHQDVSGSDIARAFRHLIAGLEDLDDIRDGDSGLVLSEMRRLVDVYFTKGSGRDDAWLARLSAKEQERVLADVKPLVAPSEYALSEDTALNGFYVRTTPRLGLASASAEPAVRSSHG